MEKKKGKTLKGKTSKGKSSGAKGSRKKRSKARKIVLGILIGYVALLAVVYIGGVIYFSGHFYLGSQINGLKCSGKSVEEVESHIEEEIASYTLTLKERDGKTESIVASQMNMQYVDDGKIQELKDQQNPFTWFLSFAHKSDYTMSATTTYDKDMLFAAIDALEAFQEANITQPADAYLGDADGGYEIVPEVLGNALDKEKVKELIVGAIDAGKTEIDFEEADSYLKPSVYSDDENLIKQRDQSNQYLGVTVTFDFADRQEVVNKDVIKDWLTTSENGDVTMDEEKVKEYVVAMAKKYDTFGYPRQFTTSYGQTITVSGGDYGWLIARNDTTQKLIEAIKSGQSQTMEPEYTYRGYRREADDIGKTYVEINLTAQHMWFYKDGQLIVDTDVVTGDHNNGWDTHTGIYGIMYKERDATLVGEGYNSAVEYWMPFYANTGIHDASWRNSFGGDIYINDGSHGCVNTPPANAEKIYNNIEKGVPVVVYK